ncbi:MAG: peptidoglycan DD-metalloendopeptidase family protein [Erysipelotrichaceae bacterium]|nr:peptidoglycan DD-metalloendopeptidase family protein [Erysipelotrichaceae bacterium]MDY5251901.1 peptidoglycan DD-metalloendopeptidase family protein [Erysipelotrichaceae bacterium]
MSKGIKILLVMGILLLNVGTVYAEDDYATNGAYYEQLCTSGNGLSEEEKKVCEGYRSYLASQSQSMQEQLKEIEAKRDEIAANIQEYAEKIRDYDVQIEQLNGQIATLNNEILVIQAQIEEKQAEIEEKQAEIDSLKSKIEGRMVASQSSMRLNKYIDILMGAKSLQDLLRRANGIKTITEYDQNTMDEINKLIEELNTIQAQLEVDKSDLEVKKQEIVEKQQRVVYLREEARVVKEEYLKQKAALEEQGNKIATDIGAINEKMNAISAELGNVAASPGWTRPVNSGLSEGTWHYSSGGVHLGADFAAPIGTPIVAAGNGVVLKSSDGCPAGYLGNSCGGSGSTGGGNQVYLLTNINGSLYAVKYLHMLAGTPAAAGTIVSAGTQIGSVGTSGNSSGPHCHVEVFYLGTQSIQAYATSWNGDLSFGAGWGSAALNRLCENGVGAPCRVKPESVFGG